MILSDLPLDARRHADDTPDHRVAIYLEEADAATGRRRVWWRCNTCGDTTDPEAATDA